MCDLCCCYLCCGDGLPSLEEVLAMRPSTESAREVVIAARHEARKDQPCFLYSEKRNVDPDQIVAIASRSAPLVVEGGEDSAGPGFLADKRATKLIFSILTTTSRGMVQIPHLGAALALVSVGSTEQKARSLFDSFAGKTEEGSTFIGGGAIEGMIEALVMAGERLARKMADIVSSITTGGAFPGGKVVAAALATFSALALPSIVAAATKRILDALDTNNDGKVTWQEFKGVALSRGSLIRRFVSWFDRKLRALAGGPTGMEGRLRIDGGEWVHARLDVTPPLERLALFASPEAAEAGGEPAQEISLLEPCVLRVPPKGAEGAERSFAIVDKDKRVWEIECETLDDWYNWIDEVDDYCEAEDDDQVDVRDVTLEPKEQSMLRCC